MANVWTQFKELLPSKYQFIGQVTTVNADGTSTITLMDSSTVRVIGDTVAQNNYALVEGNRIIAEVANLPTSDQAV